MLITASITPLAYTFVRATVNCFSNAMPENSGLPLPNATGMIVVINRLFQFCTGLLYRCICHQCFIFLM